jgi:TonB family protein
MRPLLIFLFSLFSVIVSAQDTAYAKADTRGPQYPGGEAALIKFIQKNTQYPDLERENDIHGIVVVRFVIDEQGNLSKIHIEKGVSKGIDAEALRVIKLFPKYKPGMLHGQPVKVALVLPISFNLQQDENNNGLTHSQNVIIAQKAKNETDSINRLVYLGTVYQKVLDVCKRDYAEIESIKGGVLARDLSEHQKEQLKAHDTRHRANLKAAMGDELYSKYEGK